MNQVYEGVTRGEVADMARDLHIPHEAARKVVITDRMLSCVVQTELLVEQDKLKEAIALQNDIILTLITEMRRQ